MKRCYVPKNFKPESLAKLVVANRIITKYLAMGLRLTLRQVRALMDEHIERENEQKAKLRAYLKKLA